MCQFTIRPLTLLIIALCFALIGGCARPLQISPLPKGIETAPLTELQGNGPVAWHPSGTLLATGTDGLGLFDINTASITTLDASKPAKLVWSPDGDRLATAWSRFPRRQMKVTHLQKCRLPVTNRSKK